MAEIVLKTPGARFIERYGVSAVAGAQKPQCASTYGYAVVEADTDDGTLAGDVAGV